MSGPDPTRDDRRRADFTIRSSLGNNEYVADAHEVARRQDEENRMADDDRDRLRNDQGTFQ